MELLWNMQHRSNFYKTSNTTSLILYWRLTNAEMMSHDHVQLTVNIIFFVLSFFKNSSKKTVWHSDLLIDQIRYQGRWVPLLRFQLLLSLKLKTFFIIIGEIPIFTLKISIASCCRFRLWIVTDLSLANNPSKGVEKSL